LLEQFMFTQLDVSRSIGKQPPKSRYQQSQGWQTAISVDPQGKDIDTGWKVGNLPAGFRKVMEMVRALAGRPQPVAHLVFSDGVSHVSVFAEPSPTSDKLTAAGASDDNPTTFAVRTVADHQVTVLGEVPLAAVQSIADGVTRRSR
jgi:sigma-E factor negative regulatory protein RseB